MTDLEDFTHNIITLKANFTALKHHKSIKDCGIMMKSCHILHYLAKRFLAYNKKMGLCLNMLMASITSRLGELHRPLEIF